MNSPSEGRYGLRWLGLPRSLWRAFYRRKRPRSQPVQRDAVWSLRGVECLEDRSMLSAMPLPTIMGSPGVNNTLTVMFNNSADPTAFTVTLNGGTPVTYSTTNYDKLVFIGGSGGSNEVVFDDPTSNTFNASLVGDAGAGQDNAQVVESAFELDAIDMQTAFIYGTQPDSTSLAAGSANDTFALGAPFSYIADTSGFFGLVSGVGKVLATGDGGIAYFYAHPGDTYVAAATFNQLTPAAGSTGSTVVATGFGSVYASSSADGAATGYLYNSDSNEFVGTPDYSYNSDGAQILNILAGFQNVIGVASGTGTDNAFFYDSGDASQENVQANIVANGNTATLSGTDSTTEIPSSVTAENFPALLAISTQPAPNTAANPTNYGAIDTQQIGSTSFSYSTFGANGFPSAWQSADASQITTSDVQQLLERASAATPASANDGAIIAVVDRGGNILGVRVENGVQYSDESGLVYDIDGAVAEARTAAFFSSNQQALTSRTVEFISESTIIQREVEANPNSTDPTIQGPGYVAPIGIGGNFPPGVNDTALVDLFNIEDTNLDSVLQPDPTTGLKDPGDASLTLDGRFNAAPAAGINAPESYGFQSGLMVAAQAQGIGTLPGGIPLYKNGQLVGGIGVFFPGPNGYATYEQGFDPSNPNQTTTERMNSTLDDDAELIAFAAAGGSTGLGVSVGTLGGIPAVAGYDLSANVVGPNRNIDLGGITLPVAGPMAGPTVTSYLQNAASQAGIPPGQGNPFEGTDEPINPAGQLYQNGTAVPSGWLVPAHTLPGDSLTAADVTQMIDQGIAQAEQTRAQIRPLGSSAVTVIAVSDPNGNILGLYRMPDATVFSIGVAVAKARNDAYYSGPDLQPEDTVSLTNSSGQSVSDSGLAFTSRTFRFLANPFIPEGVQGSPPGPFSILNDPGVNPSNGYNEGAPTPISDFTSVLGYAVFHPGTNFHDPDDPQNQNGVVFFPGSSSLYVGSNPVGGLGVSGDGVDQDDVVSASAPVGFTPPTSIEADQFFVDGVRLPYQEYSRNALQL